MSSFSSNRHQQRAARAFAHTHNLPYQKALARVRDQDILNWFKTEALSRNASVITGHLFLACSRATHPTQSPAAVGITVCYHEGKTLFATYVFPNMSKSRERECSAGLAETPNASSSTTSVEHSGDFAEAYRDRGTVPLKPLVAKSLLLHTGESLAGAVDVANGELDKMVINGYEFQDARFSTDACYENFGRQRPKV